jgi:hypothetical protein
MQTSKTRNRYKSLIRRQFTEKEMRQKLIPAIWAGPTKRLLYPKDTYAVMHKEISQLSQKKKKYGKAFSGIFSAVGFPITAIT